MNNERSLDNPTIGRRLRIPQSKTKQIKQIKQFYFSIRQLSCTIIVLFKIPGQKLITFSIIETSKVYHRTIDDGP